MAASGLAGFWRPVPSLECAIWRIINAGGLFNHRAIPRNDTAM